MGRDLVPAITLMTLKKIAFTLLWCSMLTVFATPTWAQDQCASALPLGSATGCGVLITVNADGTVSVTAEGNGNPYDGVEDTLVGIQNNSDATVTSITLTGSNNSVGIFAFDGDGPCGYPIPNGGTHDCFNGAVPGQDPGDYEGPNNTFVNISQDQTTGTVSFITPIAAGGSTWFALEGTPESVTGVGVGVVQQGQTMTQGGAGLSQPFVESPTVGKQVEFDFDFTPAFNANNLTVQSGTTPFVSFFGISQLQYQAMVAGTALADTFCPTALGQTDSNGATQCEVNTLTATTTASQVPSGANLPTDNSPPNTRDILFTQVFDLDPTSLPTGSGPLVIPPHTAPGVAEFNDLGGCPFPSGDPLFGKPCPRSIMTAIHDGPTKPGGTPKPAGSGQVFFCCEAEWIAQPTIPLWTNNAASIPVSFANTPPATPVPDPGGFHAAQGLGDSFGAVARGLAADPTFSFPTEQTALNQTQPGGCPASPDWTQQSPISYSAAGVLTQFDNGGTPAPFVEGPYDLLFAPLDCDEFLGLAYPPSIDITSTTPNPNNLAQWNRAPFNVDLTNPTVSVTPSAAGPYTINQNVTASVTCTDPSSPSIPGFFSGIAICGSQSSPQTFSGNLATQSVSGISLPTNVSGPQTFIAIAQDAAGNTASYQLNYNVVYPSVDLDVIQVGPLAVKTGNNATYNLGAWNSGPGQAYNVVVSDIAPSGETLLSASVAIVTCTLSGCPPPSAAAPCTLNNNSPGNTATCTVATLPAITKGAKNFTGISVKVVAKVNASAGNVVKNTATVSASNPNTDKDNSFPWFTLVTK